MDEFKQILDQDEVVLKSIKPRKTRFALVGLLAGLPALLFPIGFVVLSLLMMNQVIKSVDENGNIDLSGPRIMLVFSCVIMIFMIFIALSPLFRYKKTAYCLTNKRIIIRYGFIGVDYKSLNLSAISGIEVKVDFLDYWVKPHTGTIIFTSASAPAYQGNGKQNNEPSFAFKCIDNPYDEYRAIKELISLHSNQK